MSKINVTPKNAYSTQRNNALARGIEWELTFEEWLAWWGDDLVRRGSGHDKLQMQRIADSGSYSLGNIRKGYPKDNARTAAIVKANKECASGAAAFRKYLAGKQKEMQEYREPEQGCIWKGSMFGLWARYQAYAKDTEAAD
jgi:hypothetical protein